MWGCTCCVAACSKAVIGCVGGGVCGAGGRGGPARFLDSTLGAATAAGPSPGAHLHPTWLARCMHCVSQEQAGDGAPQAKRARVVAVDDQLRQQASMQQQAENSQLVNELMGWKAQDLPGGHANGWGFGGHMRRPSTTSSAVHACHASLGHNGKCPEACALTARRMQSSFMPHSLHHQARPPPFLLPARRPTNFSGLYLRHQQQQQQ